MLLLLILLAAAMILSFCLFCNHLRYVIRHYTAHSREKSFCVVVAVLALLGIITTASASGLVVCCVQYPQRSADLPSAEKTADPDPMHETEAEPFPELPTSTPARSPQDISSAPAPLPELPTFTPEIIISPPAPLFCLSEVENSEMLALIDTLMQDDTDDTNDTINADLLVTAGKRFDIFLDKYSKSYSNTPVFFPFYTNLAAYFPDGGETDYSFGEAESLEDCIAQLRGEGELLKNAKNRNSASGISSYCRLMAISGAGALYFTKYPVLESQEYRDEDIWLYAEIAFAASINMHTYAQPQGFELFKWYFRLADVFDYLGNIADTPELELKLYFISAVFFCRAVELLNKEGIQIYSDIGDYEIWDRYMKMLARVAGCLEASIAPDAEESADSFFRMIWGIESDLENRQLSEKRAAAISDTLEELDAYQNWKERHGYGEHSNT